MQRDQIIVRTSIIGILANVFLAGFKAVVGAVSGSIAVVLDAVNNLSDALSSVITIIGTKLAGKKPNKKHPYGYGRIEYLTAIVIAVIVLNAGITALVEAVKKIIHPELPDYSPVALIIMLDLYFKLTPQTMAVETPEVQELARLMKIETALVVSVLKTYQLCDPYLNRRVSSPMPLLAPCKKVWSRYGNGDTEQLAEYAEELKAFYKG